VNAGSFFVRWRVRLGYLLAIAVLVFARPTLSSILGGAVVGAIGLLLRGYAAGYLHKQEILTVTGPYAYTRNPLYLGSAILALGTGIATKYWTSAAIIFAYFALFYPMVMRREGKELQLRHGAAFEEYARTVPLFFPRIRAANLPGASPGAFSWAQYSKNHEWRAAVGFLLLLGVLLAISAFRHY
jgi:protein-S-isoprenylcysteine O-methyltransferase Ste14